MEKKIVFPFTDGRIEELVASCISSHGWIPVNSSKGFIIFSGTKKTGIYAGSRRELHVKFMHIQNSTLISLQTVGSVILGEERNELERMAREIDEIVSNTILDLRFGWITERIAAFRNPRKADARCVEFLAQRIDYVICLDDKCDDEICRNGGIDYCRIKIPLERFREYRHFKVRDFSTPSMSCAEDFVRYVDDRVKMGSVGVHCGEGMGRTATMLAIYLVHRGWRAGDALDEMQERRMVKLGDEQLNAVYEYEKAHPKSYCSTEENGR